MTTKLSIVKIVVSAWCWVGMSLVSLAQEQTGARGSLPRGSGNAPITEKPTPRGSAVPKSVTQLPKPSQSLLSPKSLSGSDKSNTEAFLMSQLSEQDCQKFLATGLAPTMRQVGRDVYYLARMSESNSLDKFSRYHYELRVVRLNRQDEVEQRTLFEFQGPLTVGLLVHNLPVNGFSVLSFENARSSCLAGSAVGVTVAYTFGETKQVPPNRSINLGLYGMVNGSWGRYLVDLQRPLIKTISPSNGQIDVVYQFDRNEVPLFFDQQRKTAVFWSLVPQPKISRRGSVHSIELGSLTLKVGERLVQDEDLFAVMRSVISPASVEIEALPGWTNVAIKAKYSLHVPQGFDSESARVRVDFKDNLAVVYSNKDVGAAYVFRLGRGLLTHKVVTAGQRIAGVEIMAGGKNVLLFTEDLKSRFDSGLLVFNTDTEKWGVLK